MFCIISAECSFPSNFPPVVARVRRLKKLCPIAVFSFSIRNLLRLSSLSQPAQAIVCAFFLRLQVTAEGCKNLLLAGVSATLRDDAVVSASDIGANFLLQAEDIGKNVRPVTKFVSLNGKNGRRGLGHLPLTSRQS